MENRINPICKPSNQQYDVVIVSVPLIKPIYKTNESGEKLIKPLTKYRKMALPVQTNVIARDEQPENFIGGNTMFSDDGSVYSLMKQDMWMDMQGTHITKDHQQFATAERDEYRWDKLHLLYWDQEAEVYQELCNFYIRPLRKIIDIHKHKSNQEFIQIIVGFTSGEETIEVNTTDIKDLSEKIKRKFPEAYISPEAGKAQARLAKYFAKQMNNLKREYRFHNVGWTNVKGRYRYLHDGVLGDGFTCATGKTLTIDKLLSPTDAFRKALGILDISKEQSKIVVPWLFAHLGVLYTIFELAGHNPNFLLFIHGGTGSLKTAMGKALYSIFEGDSKKVPATFKDTTTALEIKMGEACDGTLLIDDFHPASSKEEQNLMKKTLEFMIRLYGDRVGKSRSTVTLERQVEYRPHGLACITGEYVAGSESSLLRCILIDVKQGDYDGKKLAPYQDNPLWLSTHLHHFISYIADYFEDTQNYIKENFNERRQRIGDNFKSKRLVDAAVQLIFVIDFVLTYGRNIGAISMEEQNQLSRTWFNIVINSVQNSEHSSKEIQPAIMYLTAVNALLEKQALSVANSKKEYCSSVKRFVGFIDDNVIFFRPEDLYKAVVSYWRDLQSEFVMTQQAVHAALHGIDAIKAQKDGADKISYLYRMSGMKISGTAEERPRMLAIKVDRMYQILQEEVG